MGEKMSKTKFTRGPWVRGAVAQVFTAPKRIEEMPFPWEFFPICNANPCCRSKEENDANAALIAAAPEMYEFIRWIRSVQGQCAIMKWRKFLPEILDKADEILHKARGDE